MQRFENGWMGRFLQERAAKFARTRKKGWKCAFGGIKGGEKAGGEGKKLIRERGEWKIGHESAAITHRIEGSLDKHSEAVNQRRSIVENAPCELRTIRTILYHSRGEIRIFILLTDMQYRVLKHLYAHGKLMEGERISEKIWNKIFLLFLGMG